jgi:hypothetical protein
MIGQNSEGMYFIVVYGYIYERANDQEKRRMTDNFDTYIRTIA